MRSTKIFFKKTLAKLTTKSKDFFPDSERYVSCYHFQFGDEIIQTIDAFQRFTETSPGHVRVAVAATRFGPESNGGASGMKCI